MSNNFEKFKFSGNDTQSIFLLAFKNAVRNFMFLYNYFALQYIIFPDINRHVTYKCYWSQNKSRQVSLN